MWTKLFQSIRAMWRKRQPIRGLWMGLFLQKGIREKLREQMCQRNGMSEMLWSQHRTLCVWLRQNLWRSRGQTVFFLQKRMLLQSWLCKISRPLYSQTAVPWKMPRKHDVLWLRHLQTNLYRKKPFLQVMSRVEVYDCKLSGKSDFFRLKLGFLDRKYVLFSCRILPKFREFDFSDFPYNLGFNFVRTYEQSYPSGSWLVKSNLLGLKNSANLTRFQKKSYKTVLQELARIFHGIF